MMAAPVDIAGLLDAWRATHYDAVLPGGASVHLRIGPPVADNARTWLGADPFGVVLTACNPHSRQLPEAENAARLAVLRQSLSALACRVAPAVGRHPHDAWQEPGVFIAGLDLATVDALARALAQDAIVLAPAQGPVRLRLYRGDWRDALGDAPDIDWA